MPLYGHRQTAAKRLSRVRSLGDELITRCAAAPVSDCARVGMHEGPGAPVQHCDLGCPMVGGHLCKQRTL